MPIKGMSEKEAEIVRTIIQPYLDRYRFYYYGSRVKGDFRPLSDLDILVKSDGEINFDDIEALHQAFDESRLPYIVNLAYNVNEKFYNLIKNDLTDAYK